MIPLYSFLITVLGQLLLILEPALITVTMGEQLWTMLNHLEDLTRQRQKVMEDERENGVRQENPDVFALRHVNISISNGSRVLLQNDVNFEATRGQCVLISGPSGCGKTSLFRTCAGLRSIDGQQLVQPKRQRLLFIPQRPYLPQGDLRFQSLFLLEESNAIDNEHLYQLFKKVNLHYLLDRYSFDTVTDWSAVLSVGEQQRLAFVRLFAFFTLNSTDDQVRGETLVLLDESTSAIDGKTEQQIYTYLVQLQVWFVTISHRSSLVHFHQKSLQLSLNSNHTPDPMDTPVTIISPSLENNDEDQLPAKRINDSPMNMQKKNMSKWKQFLEILKLIHVPFQPDDRTLRIQVTTIICYSLIRFSFFFF